MIKDRKQKSDALKYIVAKKWFPQLELVVLPKTPTAKSPANITDIDVLGLMPDELVGYRKLLIDCKTKKKESPVNRALWLKGLMERTHASRGICLIDSKIDKDHRMMASELGVQLLSEVEFPNFVSATGGVFHSNVISNVADIDRWDAFFEIDKKFVNFQECLMFSRCHYWMCENDSEACRKTISAMIRIKTELNPRHEEHLALFGDLSALFCKAIAVVSLKIFSIFMQPEHRDDLAESLLIIIYGGRETYELMNKLRKKINLPNGPDDLKLPEWDRFVQLIRSMLESPMQALLAPLILREVAWSFLGSERNYDFARLLARQSPQAAKFALLAMEYMSKVTNIPPEFRQIYTEVLMDIQSIPVERQHPLLSY